MIRRLRRRRAELELDRVDAEIARWLVDDGTLSLSPLDGKKTAPRAALRLARLEAVRVLEEAGGRDPWPTVLREPTEAQRAGRASR